MTRTFGIITLGIALLLVLGCSDDLPKSFKAIPAGTKMLATIDAPGLIRTMEKAAKGLAPDKTKAHGEQFKLLTKHALDLLGVDIRQLKTLLLIGDPDNPARSAILAEGLRMEGLKATKQADRHGIPVFGLPLGMFAAELPEMGVVIASGKTGLHAVIDAWTGKAKRLADSKEGKIIERLLNTDKDLDLLRVYLLGVKMPKMPLLSINFHAAGLFLHGDRGAVAALLSDEAGAKDLASTMRKGISSLQMVMAFGGAAALSKDSPIPLDKASADLLMRLVAKLSSSREKDMVKVSCKADIKPLLAKATEVGLDQLQVEMPPIHDTP